MTLKFIMRYTIFIFLVFFLWRCKVILIKKKLLFNLVG